jgi:tRNA A-37 threonylcarbamoyl transferase component Bud32
MSYPKLMDLDGLGKLLRTNSVVITPQKVTKKYHEFSPTMLWGRLERKPYLRAHERYNREKELIPLFYDAGLNVPQLIGYDDQKKVIVMNTLELTDLVEVFQNPRRHKDDKLSLFGDALMQLYGIHSKGYAHGDPYLKNFFEVKDRKVRGNVYTCDFEYERDSPNNLIMDMMILVADASHTLGDSTGAYPAVFSIFQEIYGMRNRFPFDARDRFFFNNRFGVDERFYYLFGG